MFFPHGRGESQQGKGGEVLNHNYFFHLLSCLGLKVATVSFALQLLGMGSQVWMDADLGGLRATVDAR
jgi:hypothetical protein